ncbi:hypothetical protein IPV08_19770 [Methylobacterium sp. SD274]|uniref:hypothetical protein n=1 Tax=Methylobacterium sp. SD274 TaxID=2782009 RepID=UPI001A96CC74|nr:hypothetical protein [Methylobacterium sp. SD274]MBO1022202.1 hypothetical protein [Methylobacterium sp. SD274]
MLIEAIHYLTTPASRAQRRLGYLSESVRLLSRSRRCRLAWADHLAAARSAIMQSCADLVRRRTAVILGSGLLDDVPLSYLAERFERVILVDMIHPWPARWMARRHANVSLQIVDLSGCANWLRGEGERHADPLAVFDSDDIDLVVSANLLSQLPILPVDWFESRGIPLPHGLGAEIVAMHLRGLAGLWAHVCLITDTEELTEDRDGRVIERFDLLHGVALPPSDHSWIWEIAPFGEIGRRRRQRHHVRAYCDWRG